MGHQQLGLIDNWLRHIRDVYYRHFDTIEDGKKTQEEKEDELCMLNIRQSVCAGTRAREDGAGAGAGARAGAGAGAGAGVGAGTRARVVSALRSGPLPS